MLQQTTNPVQLCSNVIGRSLLEWYTHVEDYCCFLSAYKFLLPNVWRDENVRIRRNIAQFEYPRLSGPERLPRVMDDAWAEFIAILPRISDVAFEIPELKKMDVGERYHAALQLAVGIRQFEEDLERFLNLPDVLETFQPAPSAALSHQSRHADCCPHFSFKPHVMQYPPAGKFRMMIFGFKCYLRVVIYPPLLDALGDCAKAVRTRASRVLFDRNL